MNARDVTSPEGLPEALLREAATAVTFDAALSTVLETVCTHADWAYGEVWTPDGDRLVLHSTATTDDDLRAFGDESESWTFRRGEGLPGRVWERDDVEWIDSVSGADETTFHRRELARRFGLHAAVGVPFAADEIVAVLVFLTDERRGRDDRFGDVLSDVSTILARVLDRTRDMELLAVERDVLESVLASSPTPTVVFDGDNVAVRVNAAALEVLGLDRGDVVGRSVSDGWKIAPGDDVHVPLGDGALFRALLSGEAVTDATSRVRTADGEEAVFAGDVAPVLDVAGDVEYLVVTFQDVTDDVAEQHDLRSKNEELEQVAGVLSHDLRNPLSVAYGYVELARDTGDVAHLDLALEALDRMNDLIGDVLLLARRGRAVGETGPVSVATAARRAWRFVASEGATLVVDGDREITADEGRLVQLFENLFRNSVEHAAVGVVRIRTTPDGFVVEDDGDGIGEEKRREILAGEGDGFGLDIVRAIAEGHGWSFDVEAAAGGARFVFGSVDESASGDAVEAVSGDGDSHEDGVEHHADGGTDGDDGAGVDGE